MKRHPRLLAVFCVAFGLWMAGLIVLYSTSVYPRRHGAGEAAASQPK